MASVQDLPIEIIQQILLEADPLDVASFSRTCHAYHSIIYDPPNSTSFWRELYLRQPLDDPRKCYNELGNPVYNDTDPSNIVVDWKGRLQRFTRAKTVVNVPGLCRIENGERREIYRTLVDAIREMPPMRDDDDDSHSLTAAYVASLLVGSRFLDNDRWLDALDLEERQLRARLHTYFGITQQDLFLPHLSEARGAVYALRSWKPENFYGPFFKDRSGRVDWEMMLHIHLVMSMHVCIALGLTDWKERIQNGRYFVYPMSLVFCQAWIPRGLVVDEVEDWAGVTGIWDCAFCFIDHRELLEYNYINANATLSENIPLDTTLFEDPDFIEIYRKITIKFHLVRSEPDPEHPTRPKLFIEGGLGGTPQMNGWIAMTPDDQVRWHFESGDPGNAVWSSEGHTSWRR
ncbi:hypothetical protein QCA50_015384 [Cerrena zonata]|uniref:F-box domain-containing protein n=1 Tax=Cerrena zonata TaxID=2478898 RepID=A0AAW0FRU8_9APHY